MLTNYAAAPAIALARIAVCFSVSMPAVAAMAFRPTRLRRRPAPSTRRFYAQVTLTAATRLYLFEPCLDPSHEIQAAGRVHRLGQLKDVHIVRFVYKQTIEDAICELHDKVRANQIQIIDGTYSTRALRLLLSK